ncbi:MAG: hypothetical protein RJQ08_05300 [Salinisphaeraceae bacterium]
MRIGKPVLALVAAMSFVMTAGAHEPEKHDYPTKDRVEFVLDCMGTLGGVNLTTLYKCSCAIDEIAKQVSYDAFVAMDTFNRGRSAAGERPEVLREGPAATSARSQLAEVMTRAADRCIIENEDFVPETRGGGDDDDE